MGQLNYDDMQAANAGFALQEICHKASLDAGWWTAGGIDLRAEMNSRSRFGIALAAEKVSLIHSEVSESLEGIREDTFDDHLPHRKTTEVELADAVIRIADFAGAMGYDLGAAIAEKLAYNRTRADHKPETRNAEGGKAF